MASDNDRFINEYKLYEFKILDRLSFLAFLICLIAALSLIYQKGY